MKTELVTTLKRHATQILKQVREDREPVLITEHGRPSAYLIDFETFNKERKRIKVLEGIARGEEVRDGKNLQVVKRKID